MKVGPFVSRGRVLGMIAAAEAERETERHEHKRQVRHLRGLMRAEHEEHNRTRGELVAERRRADAAEARALNAESRYAELVGKMLTPPRVPPPVEGVDPEQVTLARVADDTVERMAEAFQKQDGMSPEMALQHARSLARAAEQAYYGGI